MPTAARAILAIILLGLAAFSVFGFLAAGEPGNEPVRLVWRIGYAALGLASLAGAGWLFWRRSPR